MKPWIFVDVDGVLVSESEYYSRDGRAAVFVKDEHLVRDLKGGLPTAKVGWVGRTLHVVPCAYECLHYMAQAARLAFLSSQPQWAAAHVLGLIGWEGPHVIMSWRRAFQHKGQAIEWMASCSAPWAWIDDRPGPDADAWLLRGGWQSRIVRPTSSIGITKADAQEAVRLITGGAGVRQ